jgi:hypothetical protein
MKIKSETQVKVALGAWAYLLVDHGVGVIIKNSVGDTKQYGLLTRLSIFAAKMTISGMAAEYAYNKVSKRNFNKDVDRACELLEDEVKAMKEKYDIV